MGDIGHSDRMLGSKMEIPVEWLVVAVRIQFERHDCGDSHLPRNS